MESNEEWKRQKIRLSDLITSDPSPDSASLLSIAKGLRDLATRQQTPFFTIIDIERLSIDFVAQSVHYGAFGGPDWIVWRTRLSDKPHVENAVDFLEYAVTPRPIPLLRPGFLRITDAAIFMASLIEHFANQKQNSPRPAQAIIPKPMKSAGGRPKVSEKEATLRRECLAEWEKCRDKAQVFCNRWNATHPPPKIAPKTIKRFQTWLASQESQKTT